MDSREENLISHLQALRKMLINCLTALGIGLVPMFMVAPYFMRALIRVMLGGNEITLNYFSPAEVFVLQIKTALVLDFVLCFPYIARQVWAFVLPALYENERKFVRLIAPFSGLLFAAGVLFCIFFILPLFINFGMSFETAEIKAVFGISNVLTTALLLSTVFGLMFQFPLMTWLLIRWDVVSYEAVSQKRPYVFVGILIMAALLTPPDIVSQLLLAVPTYLLFEAGLFLAKK